MSLFKNKPIAEIEDIIIEEEYVELETTGLTDDTAPAIYERTRKLSLYEKLGSPKLPKFTGSSQQRAGLNIVRFLALMLIVTIIARGTSAATMPQVTLGSPAAGDIVKSVTTSGTVTANGHINFEAPGSLTIKRVLVTPGQKVEAGTPLATLDSLEVADELARAEASLQGLNVELQRQLQSVPVDSTAVNSAQTSLDWAHQDYNKAVSDRDNAQATYDRELSSLNAARQHLANLPEDATDEEKLAAQEAVTNLEKAVTAAEAALDAAKAEVDAKARDIETARLALESAKIQVAQAQQAAANTAAENRAGASTTRLDIAEAEKRIAQLTAIQADENVLTADMAGTISYAIEEGTKTAEGTIIASIADPHGGHIAEAYVPRTDAEKLMAGDACRVVDNSSSFGFGNAVDATLTAVGEADSSGYCRVTVTLPEKEWKVGQSLQINIIQSRESYTSVVPLTAVHTEYGSSYVYRVREESTVLGIRNILERVSVNVLAKDNFNVAIEGALISGDKIVYNSNKAVSTGDKVRVQA